MGEKNRQLDNLATNIRTYMRAIIKEFSSMKISKKTLPSLDV